MKRSTSWADAVLQHRWEEREVYAIGGFRSTALFRHFGWYVEPLDVYVAVDRTVWSKVPLRAVG